ncbi:MAG: glycerophosphodiester phosphodiesterase [Candidatus Niyogibacteria bacterium]|nr:glycerophosphodiester phosphodiesterase [Candidatus Niyogibacteria bacterium]
MTAKPLIIYHRGRHGKVGAREIKENTIEAFEAAIAEGAQMIEFDVWTGLRIAHDPGENADAPTLKQALDVIGGRASVNLEIKSPSALRDAILVIRAALRSRRWLPEQIVISSFHHASAINAKALMPELCCGIINDGVLEFTYLEWLRRRSISNLHIEWMNVYMDREYDCRFRDHARELGFAIWVWTVNDRETFDVIAEYGADAIFTDRPDLLKH